MTYTDAYKKSVIAEAKRTLKRTSKENLDATRVQYSERFGDTTVIYAEPPEDRVEKWKREKTEIIDAREAEKERIGVVERTYTEVIRLKSDLNRTNNNLLEGMRGVSAYAEAIYGTIEELRADVNNLRAKLAASEAKVDELMKKQLAPAKVEPLRKTA
jgi:chromosome segregation ATPase